MPNSRQSSDSGSPASPRATNFILSSITEHSFQGIAPSPLRRESVTYVSGTMCYLCLRPLSSILFQQLPSIRVDSFQTQPASLARSYKKACMVGTNHRCYFSRAVCSAEDDRAIVRRTYDPSEIFCVRYCCWALLRSDRSQSRGAGQRRSQRWTRPRLPLRLLRRPSVWLCSLRLLRAGMVYGRCF